MHKYIHVYTHMYELKGSFLCFPSSGESFTLNRENVRRACFARYEYVLVDIIQIHSY